MPRNGEKRYNDEMNEFEYYDSESGEWLQRDEINELDSEVVNKDKDVEADIWSDSHDEIEDKFKY
ncbi:MAG: hypothetical protein ACRCX4_12640 [Bacteroidales bacterium]